MVAVTCPGAGHCAGCAGGSAVPVLALAALEGFAWVAAHLIEVAAISAACGVLAVAAVVALVRWGDRRETRHAAAHPLLVTRPAPATLTATVIPQVRQGTPPPAIERHVHFHFGPDDREAARVIRQALTAQEEQ